MSIKRRIQEAKKSDVPQKDRSLLFLEDYDLFFSRALQLYKAVFQFHPIQDMGL